MAWGGNNPDEYNLPTPAGGGLFSGVTGAQLLTAGSNVLSSALAPSPAGPSRSDAGLWNDQTFDNSGWTVATGGSTAQGGARSQGLDLPAWAILAGLALVVVGWVRTKKS